MSLTLEQVLIEAINDEYKAQATYDRVIKAFGAIRPFINIVKAEGRHIQALVSLFHRYGFTIPEDNWSNQVETPNSILDACRTGVEAEIENAAMYDKLLAATREYNDVQQVLGNLQSASQDRHLPAFQRAVERFAMGGLTIGRGNAAYSCGRGTVMNNGRGFGRGRSRRCGRGGFGGNNINNRM
ncbi:MAG TPA: DUF2202 domain-containing protein [Desulfobacterales bacterium]|nr:DUF2202 domain-containing protein [Desulfobacterales bacterium]